MNSPSSSTIETTTYPVIHGSAAVAASLVPVSSRFVIITSISLIDEELQAFKIHGQTIECAQQLFQSLISFDHISFNYIIFNIFNINESDDKEWLSTNAASIKDYIIVITSDSIETIDWLKTLMEGSYITNILKKVPTGYLVKKYSIQNC